VWRILQRWSTCALTAYEVAGHCRTFEERWCKNTTRAACQAPSDDALARPLTVFSLPLVLLTAYHQLLSQTVCRLRPSTCGLEMDPVSSNVRCRCIIDSYFRSPLNTLHTEKHDKRPLHSQSFQATLLVQSPPSSFSYGSYSAHAQRLLHINYV
jgi:hypothetical protein